jgi:truncated hemoglobin YjbI
VKEAGITMTTLFDKLGGQAGLEGAVFIFYDKMLKDPRVAHYFHGVDIEAQQLKMVNMMAFAFGDVRRVATYDLRESHASLDLPEEAFDITEQYLRETLEELDVAEVVKDEAMEIIHSTKNSVLNR